MSQNPYAAPDSDLSTPADGEGIGSFERFSAWAVFGLSLITFGIYPIYWMYTRAKVINLHHEDRISMVWLNLLVISTILSFASGFLGESELALGIAGVLNLVYLVAYLASLFKIRNRLQDMMHKSFGQKFALGPVMTFFFSAIYLQYKINECIDYAEQDAK